MAAPVQLDKAAALVGKSEVTLRRLIKAGKIPFVKEKTLTGFIYMVDPEKVSEFYGMRESLITEALQDDVQPSAKGPAVQEVETQTVHKPAVRVAVAGESGYAHEYWQKKSDLYEEKYNQEVTKHSQTREELGVWRGRAEQAQGMLMKLLPAPQEVEIRQAAPAAPETSVGKSSETSNVLTTVLMTVLAIVLVVVIGGAVYLNMWR